MIDLAQKMHIKLMYWLSENLTLKNELRCAFQHFRHRQEKNEIFIPEINNKKFSQQ